MGVRSRTVMLVCLSVLLVSACAASANPVEFTPNPQHGGLAGFFEGLWQGFIAPLAFMYSWFDHRVGIYEMHNNGGWYNLGFLIGIGGVWGGGILGIFKD